MADRLFLIDLHAAINLAARKQQDLTVIVCWPPSGAANAVLSFLITLRWAQRCQLLTKKKG